LQESIAALKAGDGWKAWRALDTVERALILAQEALAPAPRPRNYSRMVLDPLNKVLVLFGGDGEDRYFADTWLFHLATSRWERCVTPVHPPVVGSAMVAMDYDAKNKVLVLAHPTAGLWVFDTAKREWKALETTGEFARKARGSVWSSMEYSPEQNLHVFIDSKAETLTPTCPPRRTQLFRLDLASAQPAKVSDSGLEEVWRKQYGQGSEGPANKYDLAWSHQPKSQEEFRQKVQAHKKVLDAVPANTWTELTAPYSGFGRAYGSFTYDWDRNEIQFWGGGHSAYMGNEWSHYNLDTNLWMESWNAEYPVHPHGSPDGEGWAPHFKYVHGSAHGYHNYCYSGTLKKSVLWGSVVYDPDRMRYVPAPFTLQKENPAQATGMRVEMNGALETYSVSATHWYGMPFGVWQITPNNNARIKGSDTPFGTNDRAKATFDTKRNRILFYGAASKAGTCNELWAFDIKSSTWEKLTPKVEPEGPAPAVDNWNYCYSSKHDGLLIAAQKATWFYDCASNTLKKLDCAPMATAAGVIYAPKQDLFYLLDGNGYKMQRVYVFRLKL
jgi:hypothetical protein